MICEQAEQQLAEQLRRPLSPAEQGDLDQHLEVCEHCRVGAERLRSLWPELSRLPVPEPRAAVSHRFYAALDAYQSGMKTGMGGSWLKPAWITALCAACLIIGFFSRPLLERSSEGASGGQVAELREEMRNMRQLVTLSLLQQQSAAERLRGVTWSYRAESDDLQVLSALLTTVNQDANTDVRLAAVDALRKFGSSPVAQRGAVQALSRQRSPLVQIALIDLVSDMRIDSARPQLEQLAQDPEANQSVRSRAERALGSL
jgi:hypothetical protein